MPTDEEYADVVRRRYTPSGSALSPDEEAAFKSRMIEVLVDGEGVELREMQELTRAVPALATRVHGQQWRLDIDSPRESHGNELWRWKVVGSLRRLYREIPHHYPLGNMPGGKLSGVKDRPAKLIHEVVAEQLPVPSELRSDFEQAGFRLQLQDDRRLTVDLESVVYGNNRQIPIVLGEAVLYGVHPGVRNPGIPLAVRPATGQRDSATKRIGLLGIDKGQKAFHPLEYDLLRVLRLDPVGSPDVGYRLNSSLSVLGSFSPEDFLKSVAGQRREVDRLKASFLGSVFDRVGSEGLVPVGVMPDRRWGGIDSLDRLLGVHGLNKLAEDGRVGGVGELRALLGGCMPLERVGNAGMDLKISSKVPREVDFTKGQLAEYSSLQRPESAELIRAQAVSLEAGYRAQAIRATFGLEKGGKALWPLGIAPSPEFGPDASFFEVLTRTGIDEIARGERIPEPEEVRALEDAQFRFDQRGEAKVLRTDVMLHEGQFNSVQLKFMLAKSASSIAEGRVEPRPVIDPEGAGVLLWPVFESLGPPPAVPAVGAGAGQSGLPGYPLGLTAGAFGPPVHGTGDPSSTVPSSSTTGGLDARRGAGPR
ncbi:hypothetical protein [Streptomyces sp. NPDC047061]|uniref:hypothetical protein n=1 Tax=Streptomyces sp. NPDC047061 TaxID=3154605 RepID=UPI0033CB2DC1